MRNQVKFYRDHNARIPSGLGAEDQDRGIGAEAKKPGARGDEKPVEFGHE
jgi:hypothetical protein